MSLIASPFARHGRAAVAIASAAIISSVVQVLAQDQATSPAAASPQTPAPAASTPAEAPAPAPAAARPSGPIVRDIQVHGTQRIEPATVLSYMSIRPGDPYDDQNVDRSLKTLFATGLFADVKINWNG